MKFHLTFFSSLLIGLLLLNGQAFAVGVKYYSKTSGYWLEPGTWNNVGCGSTAGGGGIPNATDELIICNSTTVTVGAVSVGLNATVKTGGKLDLVTNVLTLTGALTNDGGIIDGVGAQAFVAGSIVHNGGTTDLRGVTTNSANIITVNALGLKLPTGLIGINGLFTSNVDFTMPGSVADFGDVTVTGGTLFLTADNSLAGGVIVVNAGALISGPYSGAPTSYTTLTTATALVPPAIPSSSCAPGTHLIGSPGTYACTNTPAVIPISISAPIFSIKEKARVFIEEVR